jgi:uracil-DNA glycosylase
MLAGAREQITAYLSWWQAAGYTDAVDDARHDWMAQPVRAAAVAPAVPTAHTAPKAAPSRAPAEPVSISATAPLTPMPSNLAAFDQWLIDNARPLGPAWSRTAVPPAGPHGASLMVMTDQPDEHDLANGILLSGPTGAMLDNIFKAIDLSREQVRIASVSLNRGPGGQLSGTDLSEMVAIARHHIAIAAPQKLLIVGQQACQLLFGQPVPPPDADQPIINHDVSIMAAFAIHHPRLMLDRPQMKRAAWDTIKRLREPV